jgi:hypothetical protein
LGVAAALAAAGSSGGQELKLRPVQCQDLLSELLAALLASCENMGRDSLAASMKQRWVSLHGYLCGQLTMSTGLHASAVMLVSQASGTCTVNCFSWQQKGTLVVLLSAPVPASACAPAGVLSAWASWVPLIPHVFSHSSLVPAPSDMTPSSSWSAWPRNTWSGCCRQVGVRDGA